VPLLEDIAVQVTNGVFQWHRETQEPTLKDINLKIKSGELVAVVGTVGSGKVEIKRREKEGRMRKSEGATSLVS
jgi:ABC-type transport system involved in cytochrome bd biosynthesis fused ATPase/permease subunit